MLSLDWFVFGYDSQIMSFESARLSLVQFHSNIVNVEQHCCTFYHVICCQKLNAPNFIRANFLLLYHCVCCSGCNEFISLLWTHLGATGQDRCNAFSSWKFQLCTCVCVRLFVCEFWRSHFSLGFKLASSWPSPGTWQLKLFLSHSQIFGILCVSGEMRLTGRLQLNPCLILVWNRNPMVFRLCCFQNR